LVPIEEVAQLGLDRGNERQKLVEGKRSTISSSNHSRSLYASQEMFKSAASSPLSRPLALRASARRRA
jgi:hypothetical protein